MTRALSLIAFAPLLLAGCVGAFVPIQTVETTGIRVTEAAANIPVVSGEKAKTIRRLSFSCYQLLAVLYMQSDCTEVATKIVRTSGSMLFLLA
jgi:hypothetical protein